MTNENKSKTTANTQAGSSAVFSAESCAEVGTVKWYNEQKGYGFIEQENGKDLFVHYTAIRGKLRQGDKVQYEMGEGKKGPCATKVRVVDTSAETKVADPDIQV